MIEAKSLRGLSRIIAEAKGASNVIFLVRMDETDLATSKKYDLDTLEFDQGTIPAIEGKITEFNSRGKEVARKDLPLVDETICSYRTWKDWHGQEHSGPTYRVMKVYQRDYYPAPSEVISRKKILIDSYCTRAIDLNNEDHENILHLANLMLEIFGKFEVFDVENNQIAKVPNKRLQWEILPKGKYPWAKTKQIISSYTAKMTSSEKGLIEERISKLTRYEPDFLATGKGGYSGYFIFGFDRLNLYILESLHLNNATYVFGNDWETLSRLTKNEIINGDYVHKRILHDRKWPHSISKLLRP